MKFDKHIAKLQDKLSITKSELVFSSVLLLGLLIATIIQMTDFKSSKDNTHLENYLDSLSVAYASTYIGIDNEGKVNEELAKADTVIEKEELFFKKKKEEIKEAININTASKAELMRINGIGEKTALAIIEYRKNKPFEKIEDIMKIRGIGNKKFEKFKDKITTSN